MNAFLRFVGFKLIKSFKAFQTWSTKPISPSRLGLFRLALGTVAFVNLLSMWPDLWSWLGDSGVLPDEIHQFSLNEPSFTLYNFFGYSDDFIKVILGFGSLGGIGLVLGVFTRASAFLLWYAMINIGWRNPYFFHGGDVLIRFGLFFLMFAPAGEAFSIQFKAKRFIARRILRNSKVFYRTYSKWIAARPADRIHPLAQRLLQVQLCIVYLATGIWKSLGPAWRDGDAVGIVLQLGEFQRFPVPDFMLTKHFSQIMTYSTLVFELSFAFLIWFRWFRVPMLVAGLILHVGLEWTLNLQLFQWTILSFYILFTEKWQRKSL